MMLECRGLLSTRGLYAHPTRQTQRPPWSRVLPLASDGMVAQQSIHPARYLPAVCTGHGRRGQQQLQGALRVAVVYMGVNGN